VTREWGFAEADVERMNVNGSGISLGHPVGATGKRIRATRTREVAGHGAGYGLETMCLGAGRAWPRSSSGSDRATGRRRQPGAPDPAFVVGAGCRPSVEHAGLE
jgi:hypothetical protein